MPLRHLYIGYQMICAHLVPGELTAPQNAGELERACEFTHWEMDICSTKGWGVAQRPEPEVRRFGATSAPSAQ